jgi:Tol biopolymer transport system component
MKLHVLLSSAATLTLAVACGSDSDRAFDEPDSGNGGGGAGGAAGGSAGAGGSTTGGSAGTGGATAGTGGSAGTAGSGGTAGSASGGTGGTDMDAGAPDGSVADGAADSGTMREAIVYVSDEGNASNYGDDIWVMDPDGSNPVRLVHRLDQDTRPQLSADGTMIAWEAFLTEDGGRHNDIMVANADGSNILDVTGDGQIVNDGQPSWSPDGGTLVFVSRRDSNQLELFTVSSTGTNLAQLTSSRGGPTEPNWLGNSISYQSARDGTLDVWIKSANDGNVGTNITAAASNDDAQPEISPDGTKVVFSTLSATDGGADWEIVVADISGNNWVLLTNDDQNDTRPSWSPDGSAIVWVHHDLSDDVWVMDADGSNKTNLTPGTDGTDETTPDWGYYNP